MLPSGSVGAGADDRMAQFADDSQADGVIRYTDADRVAFGQHDSGNQPRTLQDERVGSGQETFHGLVGIVGDLGVFTDVS